MDPESIVKDFVGHYYQAFDTDRSKLAALYREDSRLTFEGVQVIGTQAIAEKFKSLPFKASQHNLQTIDYQPSPQGGLFVFVTGQILPEGESYPLKFSQVFHLVKLADVFVLSNDFFRLNMV